MRPRSLFVVAAVLLFTLIFSSSLSAGDSSRSAPIGRWIGSGEIVVAWTEQRSLAIDLTIHDDGSVTGRIGDSTIRNSRLKRTPFVMRWLGNGDFRISGELEGDIIQKEGIRRDAFYLMLDVSDGRLAATINTSGGMTGGRERMYMRVNNIRLEPAPAEP